MTENDGKKQMSEKKFVLFIALVFLLLVFVTFLATDDTNLIAESSGKHVERPFEFN